MGESLAMVPRMRSTPLARLPPRPAQPPRRRDPCPRPPRSFRRRRGVRRQDPAPPAEVELVRRVVTARSSAPCSGLSARGSGRPGR
jgi:hypothetical protein